MALLLIEDDPLLSETLEQLLSQAGHDVTKITDGNDAYQQLLSHDNDWQLIILDLNLPKRNGLEALAALRSHDRDTPVLILTARATIEDRVKGLDLGADDYLAKPFALDELEARIRALLRRHRNGNDILTLGSIKLDVTTQRVYIEDEPLSLPPRELRLLACLLRNAGEAVDKSRLVEEAFGDDESLRDNALEVYIHRLRRRLSHSDVNLRTVRGFGYLLERA
ncbi:response regulator [Phytohalomonas tamaricis]|uniref:response regulator n=1 Tax=Phytohalomonas tamaricis TaxID=2081032 RepID=UPI000D0AD460|nr:response regulator transcription factor [Phytohalomonas tamaricis]